MLEKKKPKFDIQSFLNNEKADANDDKNAEKSQVVIATEVGSVYLVHGRVLHDLSDTPNKVNCGLLSSEYQTQISLGKGWSPLFADGSRGLINHVSELAITEAKTGVVKSVGAVGTDHINLLHRVYEQLETRSHELAGQVGRIASGHALEHLLARPQAA